MVKESVMRAILECRADSHGKLILFALMARMQDGKCWPGMSKLVVDTGLGRRTVIRSLKVLEEGDYLEIERVPGKGNIYQFGSSVTQALVPDRHRCQTDTGATEAREGCHTGTTLVPHRHPNNNQEYVPLNNNQRGTRGEKQKTTSKNGSGKERKPTKKTASNFFGVEIPFDEDFKDAIRNWIQMRAKMKKPVTERIMKQSISKIESMSDGSEVKAKQIVDQTLHKGWAGFFPLKNGNTPQHNVHKGNFKGWN